MIEKFDNFVEELLREKLERPLIIVGSSKIDDLLKGILQKHLLPKPQKKEDLLEGDRPLATFSARIKLCYRLGIFDKKFFLILEQLRAIRNKSAHGIDFNVRKSPIKEYIQNLRRDICSRESFRLTTTRYFNNKVENNLQELQCILMTLCIILQAILEKIPAIIGNDETLKISKK